MDTKSTESVSDDTPFDLQDLDRVLANRAECERVERRHSEQGTFNNWLNWLAS